MAVAAEPRECVLDRKVHVEDGIAELPDVPPWCDSLADEPEKFFSALRDFLKALPDGPADVAEWKEQVAARQAEKEKSPERLLASSGWGRKSSEKIAARYAEGWLEQLSDSTLLLRLGFALYDAKRYGDALAVFEKLGQTHGRSGVALIWQGHVLDLLGRRGEAVAAYMKASALSVGARHDQHGLVLDRAYVEKRIETPFERVESKGEE